MQSMLGNIKMPGRDLNARAKPGQAHLVYTNKAIKIEILVTQLLKNGAS